MEKYLILGIILIIIISHQLLIRSARKNIRELDDVDFNLSVASYTPRIKDGNTSVKLTALGADIDSTLATVNRYANPSLETIEIGDIVLTGVSIYTAEDLLFELNYIGADGEIIE